MPNVFVAGVGMTRVGRRSEPLPDLMADAAHAALAEAGLDGPGGIVVGTMNPEEVVGDGNFASHVATQMGFADVRPPRSACCPAVRSPTAPPPSSSPPRRRACAWPASARGPTRWPFAIAAC